MFLSKSLISELLKKLISGKSNFGTLQGAGSDVALGRVYVDDPDDWDLEDKSFRWAGPPHPLFTLNPSSGEVFGSNQLRERK